MSAPSPELLARRKNAILFGIFTRKERWFLSARGFFVALLLFILVAFFVAATIHDFLAPTRPVAANILVIEGWAPPWAMEEMAELYKKHGYSHLLIVRSALDSRFDYDMSWSSAEYGATALVKNGVPEDRIAKVFTVVVDKDRTYHAALGAKQWLATNNVSATGINVASVGVHARRSFLLYRKAFGSEVPLGIISLRPRGYNTKRWWRYSEGVREVIGETIAYLYARFLFTSE